MTNWRSYIDPSVGDGQNTIDGIIANGPTYGIGISDDLSVTGLSTFSDVARFSSTVRLDGQLRDGDNNFGSSGQVLSSDGTDTRWVNAGSLSAGAASLVAINDDGNTDAFRFITFVDSSSGNNALKTDSVIKYNPSTNFLNLNATGSGIKFGPGDAANDDAHIEWLGGSNAGYLRISTSDDNGTEYIQFGDYDNINRGGTFTQWLRISRDTGTFTGTFSATTFSGSGASLTSLNASNISSGTINAARVPTLNQNTTGSAATLTTTRSIGGVNFNGSANINLPGVNEAGNQNTSGNAATATVLETTRNFSISGEITANAQSFNGSGNLTLSATVDDNIIDEANLKISNAPSNGKFLQCNTGVSGGLTWADVTIPSSNTLSGTTLASGITASSITSLGTLTGLSVNGNVSVTTGSISGNGSGLTTLNASNLSSGTVATNRLPKQESGISIVGNFGQWQSHGTYTNFNTEPAYWGWNFVQGTTNAPNTTSSQWYRCRLSLGSDYGKGTNAGDYSLEMAIPRNSQSSAGGLHIRAIENGVEQSWVNVAANASLLSTGTVPDARFPSTLPAISGANLTSLNASNISSGTIAAARLPNHSAALLTSGTIPAARVPTLNQNTTGSAATLTTARTIAGTSFNGSANIDINYNNLSNKPSTFSRTIVRAYGSNATYTPTSGTKSIQVYCVAGGGGGGNATGDDGGEQSDFGAASGGGGGGCAIGHYQLTGSFSASIQIGGGGGGSSGGGESRFTPSGSYTGNGTIQGDGGGGAGSNASNGAGGGGASGGFNLTGHQGNNRSTSSSGGQYFQTPGNGGVAGFVFGTFGSGGNGGGPTGGSQGGQSGSSGVVVVYEYIS